MILLHLWEELTQWRYYLGDMSILGLMLIGLYVGRRGGVWDRDIQIAIAMLTQRGFISSKNAA